MIDRDALLGTLKPVVGVLEDSIRERVDETPELAEHLALEHGRALTAERTSMSLEEWREGEFTQAAVAWVLGCVFVRFLEDNGLIDQPLISGPGERRAAALGHREEHFRAHPAHSDREYLEACFREVAAHPAVAALYDERHNPLWRLGPSADGARLLRETFAAIEPDSGLLEHDFTDPKLDTRFLGDLYQDLSEAAKKRYALLQTPEFVEEFILDRTLDPAIEEFGLEEVRLIDPTCGSGHFLIGAFDRLFARWQDREPGTQRAVLAQRCLDQIAGVDLNPYATAIARFRLIITALLACQITRLAEAPAFHLNLATGDSLLHGPLPADGATMLFDANRLNQNIAHVFQSEDAADLRQILGRGYHAVVGNPPYIAVQDAALRDAYRARYASCHGKYVLTVPFMERFFELAQVPGDDGRNRAGFVGKITGNSFMKREFGAPLVEKFLPSVDVQLVVDSSGVSIPGHGTPTVLLFGRSRPPVASTLRVVDGIRGERRGSSEGESPIWAELWNIADELRSSGFYLRVGEVPRAALFVHPMTLGVGRDLKRFIEENPRLITKVAGVGISLVVGEDEAYEIGESRWARSQLRWREAVEGNEVRDWVAETSGLIIDPSGIETSPTDRGFRFLWPFRTTLAAGVFFGKTKEERGKHWWEYAFEAAGFSEGLRIAMPLVETHNHAATDRAQRAVRHSAAVIKPQEPFGIGLLGLLNSSCACFILQQYCHNKGAGGGKSTGERWNDFFEFNTKNLRDIPVPSFVALEDCSLLLDTTAAARSDLMATEQFRDAEHIGRRLEEICARDVELSERLVSLQEELDWQTLAAYGLVPDDLPVTGADAPPVVLGQRAFEIVMARQVAAGQAETKWFERHGSTPITEVPSEWPIAYREVVERRIALIESDPNVGIIERPENKRRWNRTSWEDRQSRAMTTLVLDALEEQDLWSDLRLRSTAELTDVLRLKPAMVEAVGLLAGKPDADLAATVRRVVTDAAVPHLAAQRLTEKGLRKRWAWERVWELQRAEDHINSRTNLPDDDPRRLSEAGAQALRAEEVGVISVPPKYARADFRSTPFWKHRGKLDVPKERFVLIPNAERGADSSPVVGWAGWDERDLARALAGRIMELREQAAADAERLVPLLAGVLELLPWIHQWHPESDALYGGSAGQYFESWLDGQLAELAVTRDTLRSWRPLPPTRGRKAQATST